MNKLLWLLQVLLAAGFLAHGLLFLFPPSDIEVLMRPIPVSLRYFLGVCEILAAIGLTVPGITRILPSLVSWAAAGLMPIMIGATIFHTMRGEVSSAITTAVLLVLLTFVAYMRWKVQPLSTRARG